VLGHPLYSQPVQGAGRWDNPSLYRAFYLAKSPEAAIAEAFGNLLTWTPAMFASPGLKGAERQLGTYSFDEEVSPIIDLDDAGVLFERGIRPTHVVIRDRVRTQMMAASIFEEGKWSGIAWWSYHRPEWGLVALFGTGGLSVLEVAPIDAEGALADAALALAKVRTGF